MWTKDDYQKFFSLTPDSMAVIDRSESLFKEWAQADPTHMYIGNGLKQLGNLWFFNQEYRMVTRGFPRLNDFGFHRWDTSNIRLVFDSWEPGGVASDDSSIDLYLVQPPMGGVEIRATGRNCNNLWELIQTLVMPVMRNGTAL